MPPKGKGGKKPSKAEKERLKREEAERKAKEEEEARMQAEQEERERIEREKREAEERKRLEEEEHKKRKGQLAEIDSLWERYHGGVVELNTERRKKSKWDRYMKCDGSPDPTIPAEINTYINLCKENKSTTDVVDIFEEVQLMLDLIGELEFIRYDTPPEEIIIPEQERYKATIKELQHLVHVKLDLASHFLSLKATELQDAETLNLQKSFKNAHVTLCMWGNLSKNPRIKFYEFEEIGCHFDIPRVLTLSDVAVRILVTDFDYYTPYCVSAIPRIKEIVDVKEEKLVEVDIENTVAGNEGEAEDQEKGSVAASREETSISKMLNATNKDENEDGEKVTEDAAQVEQVEEDDIKSLPEIEYDDYDGDEDDVDMRCNTIIGPIYHFDLIELPPQPKPVKDMILTRKVEPPMMSTHHYVADEQNEMVEGEKLEEAPSKKEDKSQAKKDEKLPIAVSIKVPKYICLFEEPQVCRWDPKALQWRTVGFSDEKFNEPENTLSFKTNTFGTFALLHDTHINMPFQSWEIRPRGLNHAHLTIIAAIAEIEMDIKDDMICLSEPIKLESLVELKDKWMPLREFIKEMRIHGVNVFPEQDAHKYVSVSKKPNSLTEERIYQQIATAANAMAFAWSDWNSRVEDRNKFIIQGCEHLNDAPLHEEDWGLFMITKKRTTMLKMKEHDENFSEDHQEGTEFHADLYHMAMQLLSDEGKKRIEDSSVMFVDMVYRVFKATQALIYS